MPGKIFISYRRDDVPGDARSIRDALAARFGKASIFMDVDNLLAGQRFAEELAKALASCDVFLAIIGPRWMDLLKTKASSGDRDYVREEIAAALKREIAVIPVRVGREGSMPALPRPDELPEDIRDLVDYQKQDVAHERFGRDAAELIAAIIAVRRAREPKKAALPQVPWGWMAATAASVLAIGWVAAHQMGSQVWWPFGGDARPALEPSKDDLAAAAKRAVLKEQAAAAEQRRREDAEAKRKAEEQAKAEAERQRLAALQAEERQRLAVAAAEQRRREEAEAKRNAEEQGKTEAGSFFPLLPALKEQAATAERRRHDEADAKRKAEKQAKAEAGSFFPLDPVAALPPGSGKSARDLLADGTPCPFCPEMVVVPSGGFTMGSPANEPERYASEDQVRVSIPAPFAAGKFAATFDEWDACVADGGCNGHKPGDEGWGRGKRPVINVNWEDAKAYAAWLSRKTGKTYRLLSEAEREYVTRAGAVI